MTRRNETLANVLTALLDAAMAWLAFFLAYQAYLRFRPGSPPFQNYMPMAALNAVTIVVVFFFARLYHQSRSQSTLDEVTRIIGAGSIGVVLTVAFTTLLFPGLDYSRWIIVLTWLLTLLLLSVERMALAGLGSYLHRQRIGVDRLLIVGAGDSGRVVADRVLRSPELGYQLVGFVEDRADRTGRPDVPILGGTDDLERIIEREGIDEIIIALPNATHEEMLDIIARCHTGRTSIKVFPDVFQIMASEVSIGHLDGLPLVTVRDSALQGWKRTLKRGVDLTFSTFLLVILSPLMLLLAALIKLDSRGPAFYTQERIGLDGRTFPVIKFRTMVHTSGSDQPGWTVAHDPRRTRMGRLLRRTSLDELPQFINVLLGDMSIVGPRPEQPTFVEQFRRQFPRYMERHREKAGITGWAQVNGLRGDTSIAERTKYDIYYIENWSIWLDFKIMLKTVPLFFRDRAAY